MLSDTTDRLASATAFERLPRLEVSGVEGYGETGEFNANVTPPLLPSRPCGAPERESASSLTLRSANCDPTGCGTSDGARYNARAPGQRVRE